MLFHGVIPPQVQDFAFAFFELGFCLPIQVLMKAAYPLAYWLPPTSRCHLQTHLKVHCAPLSGFLIKMLNSIGLSINQWSRALTGHWLLIGLCTVLTAAFEPSSSLSFPPVLHMKYRLDKWTVWTQGKQHCYFPLILWASHLIIEVSEVDLA